MTTSERTMAEIIPVESQTTESKTTESKTTESNINQLNVVTKQTDTRVRALYKIAKSWTINKDIDPASIVEFVTFLMQQIEVLILEPGMGAEKKRVVMQVLQLVIEDQTHLSETVRNLLNSMMKLVIPNMIDTFIGLSNGEIDIGKAFIELVTCCLPRPKKRTVRTDPELEASIRPPHKTIALDLDVAHLVAALYEKGQEWTDEHEVDEGSIIEFTTFLVNGIQHLVKDEDGATKKTVVLTVLQQVVEEEGEITDHMRQALLQLIDATIPRAIDLMVGLAKKEIDFKAGFRVWRDRWRTACMCTKK